jgi:hypothetical protein
MAERDASGRLAISTERRHERAGWEAAWSGKHAGGRRLATRSRRTEPRGRGVQGHMVRRVWLGQLVGLWVQVIDPLVYHLMWYLLYIYGEAILHLVVFCVEAAANPLAWVNLTHAPTTEPEPALTHGNRVTCDLLGNRSGAPVSPCHHCSSTTPPPLQPNRRHRREATGRYDATPAPTSSIAISMWDADTEWRATMMEPLPPPGLPQLQSAAPHLRFQPAVTWAPITTGDGPSSDFNRRCQSFDFNRRWHKIWLQSATTQLGFQSAVA